MRAAFGYRGSIHFILEDDEYQDLGHAAIDRCVLIHKIPKKLVVSREEWIDPWERVLEMDRLCKESGWSTSLNGASIIGNKIVKGDKSQLWQKVLPLEYELITQTTWPKMIRNTRFSPDFFFPNKDGKLLGVECKCKHREASPVWYFPATVPSSQRNQETDYYCFGQIRRGMREGYHLGVLSKVDFQSTSQVFEAGTTDTNGEYYAEDVDGVKFSQLKGWREDTFDGFFPLEAQLVILGA